MVKIKITKLFKFFLALLLFFFVFDFLIGNYVYKKILRKNFFDIDTSMGEQHPVYHHGLKKNYSTNSAGWGKKRFSFCTDNFGFRNKCNFKEKSKNFDIGIIGDSFTVGFGLDNNETFVAKIKDKLKNKNIANLASSSYSPSIYYSKIKYLLERDFIFNEIIVFLDISDLQDDTAKYQLKDDVVLLKNKNWKPEVYSNLEKTMMFLSKKFKITNHLTLKANKILIQNGVKKKSIPYWVLNNSRSSWTYSYEKKWYEEKSLKEVIDNSLEPMEKLHQLLKKNNISMSIAVYPWPATLLHDKADNKQVKIWENFCEKRCKNFYNLMDPFFKIKKKIGFRKLYFKYYIDGDIHLNKNGNQVLAKNFLMNYKK